MIDIGNVFDAAGATVGYKARSQENLFSGQGEYLPVGKCFERTVSNMLSVATAYEHWIFAFSGGKDSATAVSVVTTALEMKLLPRPKTITVMYADTRVELPPIQAAARVMLARLRAMGIIVIEVCAPMDDRFFPYMFGRGVPPPSNTFRWCTPQIKVDPMKVAIAEHLAGLGGRALTLTGVRRGESKARDDRINLSCSRNGAECGQGWLQTDLPGDLSDTFAPIDHWTLCNVWDWLKIFAPMPEFGAWPTPMIADGYGRATSPMPIHGSIASTTMAASSRSCFGSSSARDRYRHRLETHACGRDAARSNRCGDRRDGGCSAGR